MKPMSQKIPESLIKRRNEALEYFGLTLESSYQDAMDKYCSIEFPSDVDTRNLIYLLLCMADTQSNLISAIGGGKS